MNKQKYFLILIVTAACGFLCFLNTATAETSLDSNTLNLVSNTVFEVVVQKPVEDSLTYEKPLPLDLLPYSIRTDKYYSIGSAFAISPTEFVTAVHVMDVVLNSQFKEVYLRDKDKNVYRIDKIIKYSERRDFVVFSLKDKTAKEFLQVNTKPGINEKVFAVGNALGEGIVIRDGLYTSNTPEDEKGEWKWIRFSAAASPGNSGGPLLDKDGKVIGIVLLKSQNENLNYALPIAEVLDAKENLAVVYKKMKYFLDNTYVTKTNTLKKEIILPKSYQELNQELTEGTNWFTYNLLRSLFKENKNIFPNGSGSSIILHSNYDAVFPGLISQKENGEWDVLYPKEVKDAELPDNGHLTYGGQGDTLFFSIQKPDDVSLNDFYNDSKLFMDLLLKGVYIPRTVGPENVKITSLGKAREEYSFTDSYSRKWLVRTWLLEYSDAKVVTFSLPVPGGCITMMRIGQTGLVDNGYIDDMKILTNFIYASYYGTFKQWQEFLKMKDMQPSVFSSIDIAFDYGKSFQYKSKRLSFSYPSDVMEISERSYMKLMFGYFKDNNKTVWDVGAISIGENKGSETNFSIKRNMEPAKELGDKYKDEWYSIVKQKFSFNKSAYNQDKTTNIATVFREFTAEPIPVIYSFVYSKDGKAEQGEMEAAMGKFIQNVRIYEDGKNIDTAYTERKDAYHDKGDYYQALWDYQRIADFSPQTVNGYLQRGDLYKDKGDMEQAVADYARAIEKDPEYAQTYLGKDFMPLIYGVRGQFKEAKAEIEKILESDPLNRMVEPLLKVAEDALNQKIKNETAVRLFKGEALDRTGMSDEAFTEFNNAVVSNPDYNVSYDIRGFAAVARKDDVDGGISDYSKSIQINPKDIIAYNRRGVAYKIKKEYDRAITDYDKALEINPAYIKALKNRADAYFLKKLYDLAIADYDAALKIFPFEDGYRDRGLVFYNKGLYDRAIADYDKALEINQKYVDAYTSRGLAYMVNDKFDSALSDYNKAIELDPYNESAYVSRGNAYHTKGNYDQAISDYNRAIEINRKSEDAYINRGNSYASKGNPEQAILSYNSAITINPNDDMAYYNRGVVYQKQEKTDLAMADYSKAIELNSKNYQAYLGRGFLNNKIKGSDKALADYSKAIEIDPKHSEAYSIRGNIYKEKGDIDHAISDYNKAIEIDPKNGSVYYNRGISFHAKGDLERALSDYNKALELNPDNSDALSNRGTIYQDKGDVDRATADFNKAIKSNPKYYSAYYNRGISYYNKGKMDQAISDYTKAIELNPDYVEAYNNRGIAYREKGELDRAVTDFNKAVELNANKADSYLNRGLAYADKGKLELAFFDLNKAIEINPQYAEAFNQRGVIYGRKGEFNHAISDFDKALKINPGNVDGYNNRGFTFKLIGKFDQAIADFERALKINPKHTLSYINRGNTYAAKNDKEHACSDWKNACELGACENYMKAKNSRYCE
jgi:tetratricopeptide (TPR) repeat protein